MFCPVGIRKVFTFIKMTFQPWEKSLVLMFLFSLVISVGQSVYPYLIKLVIDGLDSHSHASAIVIAWPFYIIAFFWILNEVCNKVQEILGLITFPKLRAYCRVGVFNYLLSKDFQFFSRRLTGTLAERVDTIVSIVERLITQVAFQYSAIIIGLLVSLVLLSSVNDIFLIYVVAWIIYHIFISWFFLRKGVVYSRQQARVNAGFIGRFIESLQGVLTMHAFSNQKNEAGYIHKEQAGVVSIELKTGWHFEWMKLCQSFGALVLMMLCLYTLFWIWTHKHIPLGDVPMVLILIAGVLASFWSVVESFTSVVTDFYKLKDALDYVYGDRQLLLLPTLGELKKKEGFAKTLSLEEVAFAFQEKVNILDNIFLRVERGERLLILGRNGVGKTILLHIIAGLLKPTRGTLQTIGEAALINAVPVLFNRTIYENLLIANPDASRAQAKLALDLACCDDFMSSQPHGLDQVLQENGSNLSTGQCQRLCLARAFLTKASVILFDEPFANLDKKNQEKVLRNLHEHLSEKTLIFADNKPWQSDIPLREFVLKKSAVD